MTTTEVDNWPADAMGVQGPELMERFRQHAERFNTEVLFDHIHTARLTEKPITLVGDSATYTCDALIIATGASAQYLGIPSEDAYLGRGVSGCATCDGFFYKGQDVAVIGGGNTAVEEALYLSHIARNVTVVHRREKFRSEKILIDKLMEKVRNGNIKLELNHVLDEVLGDDSGVNGMRIRSVQDDSTKTLPLAGRIHRNRPQTEHGYFSGTTGNEKWLHRYPWRKRGERHGYQHSGGICSRRRTGSHLSAGGHQRRNGLHGGLGCGKISGWGIVRIRAT